MSGIFTATMLFVLTFKKSESITYGKYIAFEMSLIEVTLPILDEVQIQLYFSQARH